MRFSETEHGDGYAIEAYGTEGILIGGRRYTGGLIISPERIQPDWGPAHVADLRAAHLDELLAVSDPGAPQVIILGTGAAQVFPPADMLRAIAQCGIGFEIMDTGAACRTYNILMSEGRRVVAGLLPW